MTRQPDALAEARTAVAGARCWILSDGKAGDEAQCLGVAERLGLAAEIRRVKPRPPFVWLMPWGGIDPREGPNRAGSPLAGPLPGIVIASGRRTVPYLRKLKTLSLGRSFTVFLKDPRTGPGTADFIWAPAHDRIAGANVLKTVTSPHRISPERLRDAAAADGYGLAALPAPRVALLIGGNSRHHTFTEANIADLVAQVRKLAGSGAGLMATASRRTPEALAEAIRAIVTDAGGVYWDGTGTNPLLAMLALAHGVVVTADSVNMVGEALATGQPVMTFTPSGGTPKITAFLAALHEIGAIRPFNGALETYSYTPIDSTPAIAVELARRYLAHRQG